MANDLVDLMREFGVEVQMIGTDEEPSPTGIALAAMLTEIHEHRARIVSEQANPIESDGIAVSDTANRAYWERNQLVAFLSRLYPCRVRGRAHP